MCTATRSRRTRASGLSRRSGRKFKCRLQKQREALLGLRSLGSKYNGFKAIAAAAAGRKLSGHARSTLQLLELWRGALVDALTYTATRRRGRSKWPSWCKPCTMRA